MEKAFGPREYLVKALWPSQNVGKSLGTTENLQKALDPNGNLEKPLRVIEITVESHRPLEKDLGSSEIAGKAWASV